MAPFQGKENKVRKMARKGKEGKEEASERLDSWGSLISGRGLTELGGRFQEPPVRLVTKKKKKKKKTSDGVKTRGTGLR